MTASAPCGCDEAKEWKARALRAELGLKFARQQLSRLLGKVDEVIGKLDDVMAIGFVELDGNALRFDEIQAITTPFAGGDPSSVRLTEYGPPGSVQAILSPEGLIGFSGGTEQERQAAVAAATKAEG